MSLKKLLKSENLVNEPGYYAATCLGAYDVENERGINFKFITYEEEICYIKLYLTTNSGESNQFGIRRMKDFLILSNLKDIELVDGKYPELEGKKICFLIDIVENKGYTNVELISFTHPKTDQTAYEYTNDLKATQLNKLFKKLEEKYNEE